MSSIGYFFKESLQGFARNLSTALGSIVTIFLSLLMIGIFMVGGSMLDNLMQTIENEVTINAYLSDNPDDGKVERLMNEIEDLPAVASVSFTSKEQAIENFKSSMTANPEIIEQLDGTNPLPPSIDVELADPQSVGEVADFISGNSLFKELCEDPEDPAKSVMYGQGTVEKLFQITNYVRYIMFALIILLIFIALVFINNTIRLAILARHKEIAIMRLVGASNGFIRGPFLMEGSLHSIIGAFLAIASLQALRIFAIPKLQNSIRFLDFNVSDGTYMWIFASLIGIGLVIGLIGSAIAMRRYLKV